MPAKKPTRTTKTTRKPRAKKTYKTEGESLKVGDKIEKITKATGIKKAVEVFSQITGADCGCEERKEKMNKLFARDRLKARCITADEYYQLTEVLKIQNRRIPSKQQREIARFYSVIFGTRYEVWCDSCPEIWKAHIKDLEGVRDLYKSELEK